MRYREIVAAVLGAVCAAVFAGGIAWGAIGDGGVIQGCYDSGGNLKVVAAPPCPKGFTPLQWNQQGIQGPPGRDGLNGINGTNGADGKDGQDGLDGVSVISESEAAGAQCPDGGSRFTAGNSVTYACNGAAGQDGSPGAPGLPGDPGEDGVSGYEIVSGADIAIPPGLAVQRTVGCPLGKKAISGGWRFGSVGGIGLASYPIASGQQWLVGAQNTSTSQPLDWQVFAVCAIVD
jgi:hypothetical protein